MALWVRVRALQGDRARGDKLIRADFRGVSHYSKVFEDNVETVALDQHFEWPLARAAEAGEAVTLTLLQHSRYFGRERALGAYSLLLQQVLRDGRLALCDTMLDSNNKPLPTRISFEIAYTPPGGAEVAGDAVFDALDDDQQMLIDIEQNIANLERNLQLVGRRGSWQSDDGGGGGGGGYRHVIQRSNFALPPSAGVLTDVNHSTGTPLCSPASDSMDPESN
ncbi:otoferlin-like [Schistocerca gregaria]|uniref:otoferlin-like n=1 Tax=Schistocerca gregaria TaxID=7010 RepID=UPI00211DBDA6|nr:otoferlin-like [Schistocerca gregaria]